MLSAVPGTNRTGPMWLGLAGLAIMVILMSRGIRAAIIVGITATTIIAWIPGSGVSYLGDTSNVPGAPSQPPPFLKRWDMPCWC